MAAADSMSRHSARWRSIAEGSLGRPVGFSRGFALVGGSRLTPPGSRARTGRERSRSCANETDDDVVLFDPFLPHDGSFDPHGKNVRVLLTQGAHHRGTAEVVERFGASVWTPPRAVWRKIANPATTDEASLLPHQTCSHACGALSIAVRMPPSSSITFIRSSLQSVAKIFPPTRNDGRPW
jgi:hypothetical protein